MIKLNRNSVATVLLVTACFALWIVFWSSSTRRTDCNQEKPEKPGGSGPIPLNVHASSVIGSPSSEWKQGEFDLLCSGKTVGWSRKEKVQVPLSDGRRAELEFDVFYGPSGEPVRFERTTDPGWKRLASKSDLELVMKHGLENIYGASSEPLPKKWQSIFEMLSLEVNFSRAIHIDITWVDYQYGDHRFSAYICNDYGDRTFLPNQDQDDPELRKVRILIFPHEDVLRVDELL